MKVTGKEKDYYDSALDYSNQDQQEWFREINIYNLDVIEDKDFKSLFIDLKETTGLESIIVSDFGNLPFSNHKTCCEGEYFLSSGFVAFTGKIYPFIKITDSLKVMEVFYDCDSLFRFLKANKLSHTIDAKRHLSVLDKYGLGIKKAETFGQWAKSYLEKRSFPDTTKFHISTDNPIMIFDRHINSKVYRESHFTYGNKYREITSKEGFILLSGSLSDYQFIKVLDPFLLVQELEMFMGNILVKRDPKPVFTDKDKIQSHGFDDKISFRKRKTKK